MEPLAPIAIAPTSWLDEYCAATGWCGRPVANADDLSAFFAAHVRRFPFDMLDYFLGTPPTVDIDTVLTKFLRCRRGGGCSQHNAILQRMLQDLGVTAHFGMARVWRGSNGATPRTHMFLLLELDDRLWLCDGGYGIFGPIEPLLLQTDLVQRQGAQTYRIVRDTGKFHALLRLTSQGWTPMYQFDFRTYDLCDFAPTNYYNSLSPNSPFTRNLVVAWPGLGGGSMICNDRLIGFDHGRTEHRRITSIAELTTLLDQRFSISIHPANFANLPRQFDRACAEVRA